MSSYRKIPAFGKLIQFMNRCSGECVLTRSWLSTTGAVIRQRGSSEMNNSGTSFRAANIRLSSQRFEKVSVSSGEPLGTIPKDSQMNPEIGKVMVWAKLVLEAKIANIVDSILEGQTRLSSKKPGKK